MFKSLTGVTYPVPDLDKARQWYCQILNAEPVFDSPITIHFKVGDTRLALVPAANKVPHSDESTIAYWWVDDIEAAFRRLVECGAAARDEISPNPILQASIATVVDPWGNVMGIMGALPDPKRASFDYQPSTSAYNVAVCRAVAANEPREEIRGRDVLAEIFLGEEAKKSLKNPAAHALIREKLGLVSPGGYEYFIARTAYLDSVVEQALRDNIPQLVFLGAGYDTRACRFSDLIQDTRIFELDSRATQARKRYQFEQAHVAVPQSLTFLTINFTRDCLADMLFEAGYSKDKQTVFIWEGVIYYLPLQAVDDMLSFIRLNSPAGSTVCFDYMITVPEMENRFGAIQARDAMQATYTAEPLQFDLEQEKVETFLAERGFRMIEHLTAKDMHKRYLTLRDGSSAGEILDLFGLVQACVAPQ